MGQMRSAASIVEDGVMEMRQRYDEILKRMADEIVASQVTFSHSHTLLCHVLQTSNLVKLQFCNATISHRSLARLLCGEQTEVQRLSDIRGTPQAALVSQPAM